MAGPAGQVPGQAALHSAHLGARLARRETEPGGTAPACLTLAPNLGTEYKREHSIYDWSMVPLLQFRTATELKP
jgi:hypothetical protein